jgi:hypothetical protein
MGSCALQLEDESPEETLDTMFAIRECCAADAELFRRLFLSDVPQKPKLENRRPFGRQVIAPKTLDQDAGFRPALDVGRIFRNVGRVCVVGGLLELSVARVVDGVVSRDRCEPGVHRAPLECEPELGLGHQPQKDFVNDRFSVGPAENAAHGALYRAEMIAIKGRECVAAARVKLSE